MVSQSVQTRVMSSIVPSECARVTSSDAIMASVLVSDETSENVKT